MLSRIERLAEIACCIVPRSTKYIQFLAIMVRAHAMSKVDPSRRHAPPPQQPTRSVQEETRNREHEPLRSKDWHGSRHPAGPGRVVVGAPSYKGGRVLDGGRSFLQHVLPTVALPLRFPCCVHSRCSLVQSWQRTAALIDSLRLTSQAAHRIAHQAAHHTFACANDRHTCCWTQF